MDFGGDYSESFNNHNHYGPILPNPLLGYSYKPSSAHVSKKKKIDLFARDGGEELIPDLFTTLLLGFFFSRGCRALK